MMKTGQVSMMINNDPSGVSLTLCKDDLQQLKHFLDNHLMIPKYGAGTGSLTKVSTGIGGSGGSASTNSGKTAIWPPANQWRVIDDPIVDPTTTWDVFGKLLRALDLILEPQKEPNKNE